VVQRLPPVPALDRGGALGADHGCPEREWGGPRRPADGATAPRSAPIIRQRALKEDSATGFRPFEVCFGAVFDPTIGTQLCPYLYAVNILRFQQNPKPHRGQYATPKGANLVRLFTAFLRNGICGGPVAQQYRRAPLFHPIGAPSRLGEAQPDWPAIHRELKRPGVTLSLLWEKAAQARRGWCPPVFAGRRLRPDGAGGHGATGPPVCRAATSASARRRSAPALLSDWPAVPGRGIEICTAPRQPSRRGPDRRWQMRAPVIPEARAVSTRLVVNRCAMI
jgi:hypothetical protein